jgi:hypothetical protein
MFMKTHRKTIAKILTFAIIVTLLLGNGAIALALQEFTVSPGATTTQTVYDDAYFNGIQSFNGNTFA